MGRSIKKGPYIDQKLFRRIHQQVETGEKRTVKTYARADGRAPARRVLADADVPAAFGRAQGKGRREEEELGSSID